MNREIKYRGKSINSDQWYYGKLFNASHYGDIRTLIQMGDYGFKNGSVYGYQVDPKTVGGFTGLTDKNGKEIYEWDVLQHKFGQLDIVVFHNGAFRRKDINGDRYGEITPFDKAQSKYYEIIGNQFENPELLNNPEKG